MSLRVLFVKSQRFWLLEPFSKTAYCSNIAPYINYYNEITNTHGISLFLDLNPRYWRVIKFTF